MKYRLEEEQDPGTYVGSVLDDANLRNGYSAAELQRMRFRFLRQQTLFTIDNLTGIIRTNPRIDRETACQDVDPCEKRVDVILQPQPFFRIIRALVTVIDVNDNWPQFDSDDESVEIYESAAVGTIPMVVSATDHDSPQFSVLKYELTSTSGHFELRDMSRRSDGTSDVKLVLAKSLDRELTDVYRLRITAIDGGFPPKYGSMNVTVRVLDVNDNTPNFERKNYTLEVMENAARQKTILRLLAVDGDVGLNGEVVYSLSLPSLAAHGDLFGIDNSTGDLYIRGDLDYEKVSEYLLTVIARDRGPDSIPVTASVTIFVGDANDNAPEITISTLSAIPGTAEVAENSVLGSFVAHLAVSDKDSGENGRFECHLNDTHFKIKEEYSSEYQIVTAAAVDREDVSSYSLTLTCVDFGEEPQESVRLLRVLVTDVNDNDPVFSQDEYNDDLIENNYVGKVLMTVNATDQDSGSNGEISYSLVGQSAGLFHVDPDTGVVTAAVSFDREDAEVVDVQVVAHDKGLPSRSGTAVVRITILDVNDERPVFSQPAYSFSVAENLDPGAEVGTVAAHDRDKSVYGEVTYDVLPTDGSELFGIDHKTGMIFAVKMLDREAVSVYHLTVIASDREVPPLSSTANVTIYVNDENDNSPVFVYPTPTNNTVTISNLTPKGQVIARLRAHDLDVGQNGAITFDISAESRAGLFDVNAELGTVLVSGDLTDKDRSQFLLECSVGDDGNPRRFSFARLNVVVNRSISLPMTTRREEKPLVPSSALTALLVSTIGAILIIVLVVAIVVVCRRRGRRETQTRKYNCRTETLKMFSKPAAKPSLSDFGDYGGATGHGGSADDDDNDDRARKEPDESMDGHDVQSERSHLAVENPYTLQISQASGCSSLLGSSATKLCVNGVSCHASGTPKSARSEQQRNQTVPLLQANNKESEMNCPIRILNDNDADSLRSGEGSNADSGHGPSEEGESNAAAAAAAAAARPFPSSATDNHDNPVQGTRKYRTTNQLPATNCSLPATAAKATAAQDNE